jgi:hypothetical protein
MTSDEYIAALEQKQERREEVSRVKEKRKADLEINKNRKAKEKNQRQRRRKRGPKNVQKNMEYCGHLNDALKLE